MTKRILLAMAFTASAGLAQFVPLPSPNNPYAAGAAASAAGAAQAYRSGLESKARAQELKIEQGWLDLARQQANQKQPNKSGQTALASADDMKQALLMANMAHPDFAALTPIMQIIALSLSPDWSKISTSEYLECLYVIAKNASFAAQSREKLLGQSRPAPAEEPGGFPAKAK
jgi:hypothetical protein